MSGNIVAWQGQFAQLAVIERMDSRWRSIYICFPRQDLFLEEE